MKRFLATLFTIIGVLAVGIVVSFAIVMPDSFKNLGVQMGIVNETVDTTSLSVCAVPYAIDFGNAVNLGTEYKSTYLTGSKVEYKWYCAWGQGAESGEHSLILGWDNSGLIYKEGIISKEKIKPIIKDQIDAGYHYSFLLQDFDFYQNHELSFAVSKYEEVEDQQLYLIGSSDRGVTWSAVSEIMLDDKEVGENITITRTYERANVTYRRYGLLLISKSNSCRLEVKGFTALALN